MISKMYFLNMIVAKHFLKNFKLIFHRKRFSDDHHYISTIRPTFTFHMLKFCKCVLAWKLLKEYRKVIFCYQYVRLMTNKRFVSHQKNELVSSKYFKNFSMINNRYKGNSPSTQIIKHQVNIIELVSQPL